jgi:hypothetical protein
MWDRTDREGDVLVGTEGSMNSSRRRLVENGGADPTTTRCRLRRRRTSIGRERHAEGGGEPRGFLERAGEVLMGNHRRLSISLREDPAIHATRVNLGNLKLVYALVANKRFKYPKGKSRVVYIGTTRKGSSRVAHSVSYLADAVLGMRGVRTMDARIITCRPRQRVRSWLKLERALLITFREMYGQVPHCNSHGRKMKVRDELGYFSPSRLRSVLEELA